MPETEVFMMVVGVSGKAGCGKDTIGDYLVSRYGFNKDFLAAPIKRMVEDVFVLDHDEVYDRIKREQPLEDWPGWTVRKLLQYIGTEMFRRGIDEFIWVKSLCRRIRREPGLWVVTDVRFPNEGDILRESFGDRYVALRVERDVGQEGAPSGIPGHESEKYTLGANHVIDNNGSLDELYYKLDGIMSGLGLKKICGGNLRVSHGNDR